MKILKFVIFFIVALLIPSIANAQVCDIKGTNDTVEVVRSNFNPQNNTLSVTVNSDSQYAVNLTVTVQVVYVNGSYNKEATYIEKFIAYPSASTTCNLTVPNIINTNYTLKDYKISLSGKKCEKI